MTTNQRTTKLINGFSDLHRIVKFSFLGSLMLICLVFVPLHAQLQTESVEQQITATPADTLKSEAELRAEREQQNKRIREIFAKGAERARKKKKRRQVCMIIGWITLIVRIIMLITKRQKKTNSKKIKEDAENP